MAWRPPERRHGGGLLVPLLVAGLTACSDGADQAASLKPLPPQSRPVVSSRKPSPSPLQPPLSPPAGLTPLASQQQLLGSLAIGREDPFAALQPSTSAAAGGAVRRRAPLPADFQLLGLVSAGRSAQAMVRIGSRTGTLCPGPRGRCPGSDPLLLPPGWSVERVAAGKGLLVLRQGRQRQVLSLALRS